MAAAVDRHSRRVGWLKIVLPLAALAILSTLFLFSRGIGNTGALPFADADVTDLVRDPRISAPDYTGVTEDGAALNVTAQDARPGAGAAGRMTADGLRATMDTPDGVRTVVSAREGVIDGVSGALTLTGDVLVTTSGGYVVTAAALTAALDRTSLRSTGAVEGTGPMGRLTAGQMRIEQAAGSPATYVMIFTGGVKLIYEPQQ